MKESRKNRGNGLIWAIILVVIAAIVVTFIVIAKSRKYEPGKTENGVYLNKWADVQIRIPDGLTIYQKQDTDSLYSELYMKSSTESSQMFGFAAYKDPSIDTGMEEMKQVFLQAVGRAKGINITVSNIQYPKIAGKEYKYLPVKLSGNGVTVYIGIYGRQVNSHGSFILVAGSTESEAALNDLIKQNVSSYK